MGWPKIIKGELVTKKKGKRALKRGEDAIPLDTSADMIVGQKIGASHSERIS